MKSTFVLRSAVIGAVVVASASAVLADGRAPRETRPTQPAQAGPKQDIIIRGSTTWEPINILTPARFAAVQPKINLDIEIPPIGSTGGVRALIEGTCVERGVGLTDTNGDGRLDCDVNNDGVVAAPDATVGGPGKVPTIAQSSRPLTAGEFATASLSGLQLVGLQGGRDALAIVVNAANPLPQLSKAQIQNIYLNPAAADWALYGGTCPDPDRKITVYTRNTNGGTFDSFIDLYLGSANRAALLARMAAGTVVTVDTALDGVAAVAGDQCGIFYAGIGDFATEPAVRGAATYNTIPPGIVPSQATVLAGTFPFARSMYFATIGVPGIGSAEGKYLDWMLGRSGQSVVYEAGFVPSIDIQPLGVVTSEILSQYPAP